MIQGKNFIIIGIQPWDIAIGSNCKNIAEEIARNNKVLFVNLPLDRITRIREKSTPKIQKRIRIIQGKEPDIVEIGPNMWNLYPKTMIESISWIKIPWIFDFLNKRNNAAFSRNIREAAAKLGFRDYILFNDNHMYLGMYIKEMITPELYVYYIRDYLIKNFYWKKHGVRIEPQVIRKADLVVTNSTFYEEYARPFNPNSHMVGQGCDLTLFNPEMLPEKVPVDIAAIKKPVIGYIGALSGRRLDISLIGFIASQRPDWNVVLVGPEDEAFAKSDLHKMSNVHFLGSKPPEELPVYLNAFDVAFNPQVMTEVTIGNYPRKIDEYLAMGKPTLASPTKAMEYFGNYVYLAATPEEYVKKIEIALQEDSKTLQAGRREFATQHSWTNNVENIYSHISATAERKGISL